MKKSRWIMALVLVLTAVQGDALTLPEAGGEACAPPLVVVAELPQVEPEPGPKPAEVETRKYLVFVDRASRAHGVDGALVHALIFAESSYDPNAVSPAGATGLMQLMPATAKRYGVSDLFDPEQNIRGGVRHLKDLLVQFDGDIELAIAAYNAGPNAVIRAGMRIPPYPETTTYVPKVIGHYRRLSARRE
jgi:soluble lytic murein transglycosylase-like protein